MPEIYKHGVYIEELATALSPMISVTTPTVVIGSCPIHLASDPAPAQTPILITSLSDFAARFGYSSDFDTYTACEAAYVHFSLFNVSPLIVINVLDATKALNKELTGTSSAFELTEPVVLAGLVVKSGTKTLTKDTDYTASYEGEKLIVKVISQTNITDDKITLTGKQLDTVLTAEKIIGGVNSSGQETGLSVLENIYPRLGIIPGALISPKWSSIPAVAQAMASAAASINGVFKSIAICDIDTGTVRRYDDVNQYKNRNNLVAANLIVCYPLVSLNGVTMHLSTQLAALMNSVDSSNSDIPYESPSNKTLRMDSSKLSDGTEEYLSKPKANILNGGGIVTALNFNGWRAWGSRTGIYPSSTDVKDSFIPCRRMFDWVGNTLAVSFFSRVDLPISKRLINDVLDSANLWLAGLTSAGALIGGRVYFLEEENPATDLLDGKISCVYRAAAACSRDKIHIGVFSIRHAGVVQLR